MSPSAGSATTGRSWARCSGLPPGRRSDDEITVFDSTGLAIQDLAIALAALEPADQPNSQTLDL